MKIECPYPTCRQRIAIQIEDAGTENFCPACGNPFTCPGYDDFPDEEKPQKRRHPRKPSNTGNGSISAPASFHEAVARLPGGKSLQIAFGMIVLQIAVPVVLICLGSGMMKGDNSVWIVAVIFGGLLQAAAACVWKAGWSFTTTTVALILEALRVAIAIYEFVNPEVLDFVLERMPESMRGFYPILNGLVVLVCMVVIVLLIAGSKAAAAIDAGAVRHWKP